RLRTGCGAAGCEAPQGGATRRPAGAAGRPRGAREASSGDPQHGGEDPDERGGGRPAGDNQPAVGWRMSLTARTPGGAIRADQVGRDVDLYGWVHRSRDLGGLIFIDLRDRAGIVQVSFDPRYASPETLAAASGATAESVVLVQGEVVARPPEMRNPELATGDVEVRGRSLVIVGPAVTPAIPVARGRGEKLAAEELRLRHRYLDLRRPELRDNIVMRHR